ncbi:DUF2760 domain-containing protein [Desulfococcus multivorans]|uniref:DUF2760 domain-containing protein n=1 Tax=Desulfococcus multivorans DSM 2059 TaxID=1121405 RepID=S7V3C8_DESML|nr:DUF2760 domain-containing protein [Desulfococcus multivorans]AOY58930.1 conserved uncharacterized protein, DUF2760 [Desulfococcus multivorans]AQV01201.1 hypothetical protein B2D07_10765 [Desulfococcus multivorans]EPR39163.1 protein of unknown function DUF2760-containing protein [Desulfococcus multivorans DSM 2059]SJZ53466.1 protein of unknown function [Desulfococcus multivorans DSM 2059]
MNVVNALSRRAFFWVFFFSALMWFLIDAAVYVALNVVSLKISVLQEDAGIADFRETVSQFKTWIDLIAEYYIPASVVLGLVFILLLWLCLRLSFPGALRKAASVPPPRLKEARSRKKDTAIEAPEPTAVKGERERLYLYLFSILQREGRLMDFLAEDIDAYDDADIGAAVRSIHENCRKIIDKYIIPKSILSDDEESEITVEPGFDPNAVKLTGNVAGNPPFRGIVRHKGWKAGKLDMPTLSGERDPRIIAPAEVEIL